MSTYKESMKKLIEEVTCEQFIHPGIKCRESMLTHFLLFFPSSLNFFIPLSLIPIFTSNKGVTYDIVKKCLLHGFHNAVGGYIAGTFGMSAICLIYKMLGRFTLYTAIGVPALFGLTVGIIGMKEKSAAFFQHAILSVFFEVLIRMGVPFPLGIIRQSMVCRTIAFMLGNAVVLHLLREMKHDVFWFIRPFKRTAKTNPEPPAIKSPIMDTLRKTPSHVCCHKESCDDYLISGVISYLKAGVCLEVVQITIKNFGLLKSKPMLFFKLLPKKLRKNLIVFLMSHIAIYRFSNCLLNRFYNKDSTRSHTIASFLSGSVFFVAGDLAVLGHTMATTLEISCQRFDETLGIKSKFWQLMKSYHVKDILFIMYASFLFHIRIFYPWLAPHILIKFMNGNTNGLTDSASLRFYTKIFY